MKSREPLEHSDAEALPRRRRRIAWKLQTKYKIVVLSNGDPRWLETAKKATAFRSITSRWPRRKTRCFSSRHTKSGQYPERAPGRGAVSSPTNRVSHSRAPSRRAERVHRPPQAPLRLHPAPAGHPGADMKLLADLMVYMKLLDGSSSQPGGVGGPFCSMLLADLGAEVIKIEEPSSVPMTAALSGRPFVGGENAHPPVREQEQAQLRGQLEGSGCTSCAAWPHCCDVILENFRPRWPASSARPQELRQTNPGLVSCSISGFGAHGAGQSATWLRLDHPGRVGGDGHHR